MLTLLLGLLLTSEPQQPDATEIVKQAVQTTIDDRVELERRNIQYLKTKRTYDTSISPTHLIETEVYRMWYENGESRQQLIERDGKPLKKGHESAGEDAFETLPGRYDFSWSGDAFTNARQCRPCYLIRAKPREKGFKPKTRREKVLAHMEGLLFIDQERSFILFASSYLPKKVSMGWGRGAVHDASFEFSQRLFDNIVVFDKVTIEIDFQSWIYSFQARYEYTYSDYGPRETQTPSN